MKVWTKGYLDRHDDTISVFYTEEAAANDIRDWIENILADDSDDLDILNDIKTIVMLLQQEKYKEAVTIFSDKIDENFFVTERDIIDRPNNHPESHMLSNLNDALNLVESQIEDLKDG